MPKIEDKMRQRIAASLPQAIRTALNSYKKFAETERQNIDHNLSRAKQFKEHHDACKVAIAHIKLLIDLAKWADLPDPTIESDAHHKNLLRLMSSAQAELDGKRP